MLRVLFCRSVSAVAGFAILVGLAVSPISAKSPKQSKKPAAKPQVVELFAGMKSGYLKVRVVTSNEFQAKVWITNTTAKPLTVQLPKAVAAVQVLKQQPGGLQGNPFGNFGQQQNGNQNGNGGAQSVGGNFGQQGNQFGNQIGNNQGINLLNGLQGPGNGFFSVPSKRSIQLPLHTVCLEHGKPTPRVRLNYELRPLDSVVTNPALQRVLTEYDARKDDRMAVQAATWHLANGMSWRQLQAKTKKRLGGLRPVRYFQRRQLAIAWQLVEAAKKTAKRDDTRTARVAR